MPRWEVQTEFTYGFENCWRDENDELVYFATFEEADAELNRHLKSCTEDWRNGNLADLYMREDFQIVKISD